MSDQRLQYLIELVKRGDGAQAAVSDLKAVETAFGKTSNAANQMRDALRGALAGVTAGILVREMLQATVSMERMQGALRSVTGSSQAAGKEFEFVTREAKRLGLDLEKTAAGYVSLTAAARGTALEGKQTRDLFTGIAEASAALRLSADQTQGALIAVQQVLSKGTVSAEELRGQLGERLPGAFNLAAQAMGVTTAELGKMLERGEVVAADFLPRLAAELHKTFGPEAEQTAKALSGVIANLRTEFFQLKSAFGGQNEGAFKDLFGLTTNSLVMIREHKEAVQALAVVVGSSAVVLAAVKLSADAAALSVGMFGAAWLKSAADVQAATTLIATSNATMAASMAVGIAGSVAGVYTLVEAYRMLQAQMEEAESKGNLEQLNLARRAQTEREIDRRAAEPATSSTHLPAVEAERLKKELDAAFTPKPKVIEMGNLPLMAPVGNTTRIINQRDTSAEEKALRDTAAFLNPSAFRKPAPDVPTASGSSKKAEDNRAEIESKAVEHLASLKSRMHVESLSGLEQEHARIQANYQARQQQIETEGKILNLQTEELAQLHSLNLAVKQQEESEARAKVIAQEKAEARRKEAEMAREAGQAIETMEQQLTSTAIGSSETRVARAEREFNARIVFYDELFVKGKITEEKLMELSLQAGNKRKEMLYAAAEEGQVEAEKLSARQKGIWEEQTVEIRRQFERRRENLEAYYALELDRAQGNADRIREIESQKTAHMRQLSAQEAFETNELSVRMREVGRDAQVQFAGGLARSFTSIIEGSKNAKEAFRDFAASFLKQVAEMIMQTLILMAVQRAVGMIFPTPVPNVAALGGIFPSPIFAAHGALALGGPIPGVGEVSQETYLPKFNVIAGEAGREILTVLAQPHMAEINGVRAMLGNAQGRKLAILSAADLPHLAPPKMMSLGGMIGGGSLSAATSSGPSSPMPQGKIEIVVRPDRGAEAAITHNAIEGALARVTNELTVDSAISQNVKRLNA
ncbi:MAG: tape measure protein [Verrucomicrobiota bacterium]|nr:tape measure protein [Verrucomicrobiota bacterium]